LNGEGRNGLHSGWLVLLKLNDLIHRKGDKAMPCKVLITRKFRESRQNLAHQAVMELRSLATLQHGYMSGETLVSADDPNKIVVVSTWVSRKRWEEWQANPKRKEVSKKIDELLEVPEQVECFLVGEKAPAWVDMA